MPKLVPTGGSSTPLVAHAHVVAHMSITPACPSQTNVTLKQQVVPAGVPAAAVIEIHPVHPAGTGFGASVWSSLSSLTVQPGHTPEVDQLAPAALLQNI